jgi:hypothetical protein
MAVNTASGCKVYIGTTATNPSGDTYTQIGFISNAGAFGRTYSLIKFDSLPDRNTLKFKGQRDDGNMTIEAGRDAADAGQAAVITALDSDQDYNFQVVLNDSSGISGSHGTQFLFKAKVMSYPTTIGTPTNVVMTKFDVQIKSGSIIETPAT